VLVTSWVSQRIVPMMNTDPTGGQTSLLMNVFMVILITNISLTLPSGLSLYFIVTNLISILQFMLMGNVAWRQVFSFRSAAPAPPAKPAK
jgi:YidC/Oxa1 family membrane protein insertase